MKKILLTMTVLLVSLNVFAARYEEKDILGRLMVTDQQAGTVQGVIEIKKATKADNVLFALVANVNLGFFKGQPVSEKCSGQFEAVEQMLTLFCNNNSKVLALKLNNENQEMASYLRGSFTGAKFSFVNRPLTAQSEEISVDIKNLDLRN